MTTPTSAPTTETSATPAPAQDPAPTHAPSSRSFLLGGVADALYNSRVYAERLRLQEEIGERSFPIIGGLGSKLLRLGETYIMRPLRMTAGLVIGARKVDPDNQQPAIPAALGASLQHDLPESYHNRVEVAEGRNEALHGIFSLSPTRYQQGKARAVHAEAVAQVRTMPEDQVARDRTLETRLTRLEHAGQDSGNGELGGLSPQFHSLTRRLLQHVMA